MHIPDGFIPLWQCAIYGIIVLISLILSLRWARKNLDEKTVPLMGILAAGIFIIMSMNVPTPLGASGHMVGGALIAIIFCAPEASVIIFTIVLLVQALYGDGGITALGANIFNMGIIGGFVGLYSFKTLRKIFGKIISQEKAKIASIFLASWLSIFITALAVALELWWAGKFPLELGLLLMGLYHTLIGVIEGILTVVVILALEKVRPDLLAWNRKRSLNITKSESEAKR
jgi:cobalt/nickel transport system permease protein